MPTTAASTELIRSFDDLLRADVPFAGGKGANLGELTSAGLPVPPGFVVGAPAYAAFCDENGLRERLESLLSEVDVDDSEALRKASAEARTMVAEEPVAGELREEIARAYGMLVGSDKDAPVAVRSSATGEDTESASFAGMNETYLNVRGADEVVEAVRSCWASLFGARTVFYRSKRGFGQADMDIAVVVQRQIESTRAGVMFTIDPATGDEDRLVIEGSFGLGEAVVSGSVSPDRYLVEKDDMAILSREVRSKELVIESVSGGSGTVTREARPDEVSAPVLSDEEVREVAGLGVRIEGHYGSPQDTEWAFDPDGVVYMLQSRPVTVTGTTPREPVGTPRANGSCAVWGRRRAPRAGSSGWSRPCPKAMLLPTARFWSRT